MKRRNFLQSALGWGAIGVTGWPGAAAAVAREVAGLQWRERNLLGFGSQLSLRVAHADAGQAEQALDAAVVSIRAVEAQMSLFNADSAICRLNRDAILRDPDPALFKVLQLAQSVAARSQGSFDVTVQPLWLAFEAAARRGGLPTAAAVAQARALVGWRALAVAPDAIRFLRPGMGITLNGIAQGFAADLVRTGLQARGVRHALINTGEWTALGDAGAQQPWLLGLADPRQEQALLTRLALDGRSIATSADNACSFSPDRRHHHIVDPHTGYSPPGLASVTVAAPICALADALTKVMFMAGRQGALRLARQWRVDVLVVDKRGQWEATPGLRLQAV